MNEQKYDPLLGHIHPLVPRKVSEPKTPQGLVATYVHVDINGDILAFDERGLIAAIAARDEQIRQQTQAQLENFLPTPEAINELPKGVRKYIAYLETRCDPAGDLRALICARDNVAALEKLLVEERAMKRCHACGQPAPQHSRYCAAEHKEQEDP